VEVSSFGTLDLGPVAALPEAVALAGELGLDLSGHRARHLADLGDQDLVVGFERAHLAAAVVDAGADLGRTFTLSELVELLNRLSPPPGDARGRIAAAHAARPPDFRGRPLLEIRDPLGLAPPAQRAIARAVREEVEELAAALFD
jgi:protein-tyrosine-phosphatase